MTNNSYTRIDRFQLWFAKQSFIVKVLVMTAIFTVLTGAIYGLVFILTVPDHRALLALIFISTVFIGGVLFAFAFAAMYKYQAKLLGEKLQIPDLTPVEMVELHIWFRRGIVPAAQRLLQAREQYLNYLQPIIEGKQLYPTKRIGNLLVILAGFNVVTAVLNIFIISTERGFHIFTAVIWLFVLLLNLSYRRKSGSPFAKLFNRRSTRLMAERRVELAHA